MWLGILLCVLAVGIGLAIGIPRGMKIKKLREDGKIVVRNYRYAEKGEEFTSRVGSFEALKYQLENAEIPCGMQGNTATQVDFSSSNFAARLYKVDFDEPSGIGIFRFEFTRWKTARYGYMDDSLMNMLMTSVEKAFFNLDPNTGVKFYDLNFKTHHSIL